MAEIEEVGEVTPEIIEALHRILPQLNPRLPLPAADRLQRLIEDPDVTLVVARDGGRIIGTTTVIVYTTPYWIKARLDEVVVDADARGKGVGEALVRYCLEVGRRKGAQVVELQSGRGEQRAAAHRLYKRIGFEVRNSDLFRLIL